MSRWACVQAPRPGSATDGIARFVSRSDPARAADGSDRVRTATSCSSASTSGAGTACPQGGHPMVRTPHLDELAGQGVRFRGAYSAIPTCVPARAALHTGLRQTRHGRVGVRGRRAVDVVPHHAGRGLPGGGLPDHVCGVVARLAGAGEVRLRRPRTPRRLPACQPAARPGRASTTTWPPDTVPGPGPGPGPANGRPASLLLCGACQLSRARSHPLLSDLPDVIHIPARIGTYASLRTAIDPLGRGWSHRSRAPTRSSPRC
ncbi:cupin domain-containing protein [Streptomyces sp. ISL-10]|uniref:cupin domain-containing protein n=1 Tax=Streptomyces sp. ISL-10 TaxID=2819172 RepID=UPI0027E40E4C|nr:cupin domain-containing protein [Streptomyces sp. ISL-10]